MGFSNSAAPTRANIRKRLDAAREALQSAEHLIAAAYPSATTLAKAVNAADAWSYVAQQHLATTRRKRGR